MSEQDAQRSVAYHLRKGAVSLAAIVSLAAMGTQAVAHGIDGVLLAAVIAAISGIAGYELAVRKP